MYFSSARPLGKESVLKVFEDVGELTKIFVAPFGVPHDTTGILGSFVASNDIRSIYGNWEDSLSKKIYIQSGISDDRVAASIQMYIEEKRDQDVMRTVRKNDASPNALLDPSPVVEFSVEQADADVALAALQSVVRAIKVVNDDLAAALCSPQGRAARKYPLCVLNPSDVVFIASTITMSTLRIVSDCLQRVVVPSSPQGAEVDRVVSLTYEQYVALLDAHIADPFVYGFVQILTGSARSTNISHVDISQFASGNVANKSEAKKELHMLRCCGILHRDLQFGTFFCHPMQTAMYEMEMQLDVLCPFSTYVNENSLTEEQADLQTAFLSSMELLHSYNHIRQIRHTRKAEEPSRLFGGRLDDDDDEPDREGDTLQALCCVDEAMAKLSSILRAPVEDYVDDGSAGPPRKLRSELLIERAVCRSKLLDFEEALRDVNSALKLDPKSSAAYKCRFKIYQHLAQQAADRDELDGNGVSEDEDDGENVANASASRLLLLSARDALAAFVLGGSSNLILAGEAEDAARESCREDAKAFFWKRLNGDCDEDDDEDDDDEDDDDEDESENGKGSVSQKQCNLLASEISEALARFPMLSGNISSLCSCGTDGGESVCEACASCGDEPRPALCKGLYSALLRSSCIPKDWLVQSFAALYAPVHIALDIPPPLNGELGAAGRPKKKAVAAYDDGLGEEPKPFEHLLGVSKVSWSADKAVNASKSEDSADINGIDGVDEQYFHDQPDGDDDAFRLICSVANALAATSRAAPTAVGSCGSPGKSERRSPGPVGGLIAAVDSDLHDEDEEKEYSEVHVYTLPNSADIEVEIATALQLSSLDDMDEMVAGSLPVAPPNAVGSISEGLKDISLNDTGVNMPQDLPAEATQEEDMGSFSFMEAFRLVTEPIAHHLTGVLFTWKIIGVDSFAPADADVDPEISYDRCRFRVTASLTSEMQDAICDRSMHNSMHNADMESGSDDDTPPCSVNGDKADDDDEDDDEDDESGVLRKVSRRLRARLLSLCGSIAYLLGDSMGGYQCMKASILLDGECLDSRIKISTMLMEMDELDKAAVHIRDANRKWSDELLVELHQAQLMVHQTDYEGAVQVLRSASRKLDIEIGDDIYSSHVMSGCEHTLATMRHLAPTITALHGVAEFRVNPENPERALSVLQRGAKRYPHDASMQICLGEVLGQAGNPAGALKAYALAAEVEPTHPMPYLNASKLYQQMNQLELAKVHMRKALRVDSSLAITLVDIAQFKIHESRRGNVVSAPVELPAAEGAQTVVSVPAVTHADYLINSASAAAILDSALDQSRHVSEIIDVFTAKKIAGFYSELQESGLAPCIG